MILLDTHTLLWSVMDSRDLGDRFRAALESAWQEGSVAASSFVFWEIALLQSKNRLDMAAAPRHLRDALLANGLNIIPVDDEIAIRSVELGAEGFHPDPADRIITATAILGGYQLATVDAEITQWAERTRQVAILNPIQ